MQKNKIKIEATVYLEEGIDVDCESLQYELFSPEGNELISFGKKVGTMDIKKIDVEE